MIPGLFMWPGMVGGRRSVAALLSAYPNLFAYFEAGLGETTDPGPPVKVSQLVSPIYVDPGGGPIDAPRKYIRSIDQATFANMFLRNTTGWSGGLESLDGSGGSAYMDGTLASAISGAWGFTCVVDCDLASTERLCADASNAGVYVSPAGSLIVSNGSGPATWAAGIVAGKHIISVLDDGAGSWYAWVDGVSVGAPVALASAGLAAGSLKIGSNSGGVSNWTGLIRSAAFYIGNWTTDGTRAGIESFLNSRAGGGII